MATPRVLARPPITEALVDFRVQISQPPEVFEAFAKTLQPEFLNLKQRRGLKAQIEIRDGKLIMPKPEDLGFQGVMAATADGTLSVQLRPDGFTFNNLKQYVGGDRLIAEALEIWTRFAAVARPPNVSRIALRYINHLALPFSEGDEFGRFLTAVPDLPVGAPQKVSEFLYRTVAHEIKDGSIDTTAVVTRKLDRAPGGGPLVIIDVDVFKSGDFPISADNLRPMLEELRLVKNRTFFSLLTEEAVQIYA